MVIIFSTVLLSSGCSSFSKTEQPLASLQQSLDKQTSLGQTALARYDGLQSVSLFIQPETAGQGDIRLALLPSHDSSNPMAAASISRDTIFQPGIYTFTFPALAHSNMQDFFIALEYIGEGSVSIGIAPGNMYLNGALYINEIPQEAQLSFSLGYDWGFAALGLAKEGFHWFLRIIAAIILFVIPGWALLSASWKTWGNLHWTQKLGLSAGASLSLYPVLMLWTNLIGLNLGGFYAWIPPTIGAAFLLWKSRYKLMYAVNPFPACKQTFSRLLQFDQESWADLALLIVLGTTILVRFWAIRSLEFPMWGDSYQHTLITQLLVDNRGLFTSWQPYTDLTTFSYHFGFHSLAAVYHWFTGLSIPQSTLWTGQILNILAVVSLVPLAVRLGRTRWASVAALLLAGLLFQMPNFYLNWGRYPQLAGQVILASLAWLLWDWLDHKKQPRSAVLALCLIIAGLAMTHYRVVIMTLLFLLTYGLLYLRKSNAFNLITKTLTLGAGSLLLFLPWFMRAFSSDLTKWLQNKLSVQVQHNPTSALQLTELEIIGAYIPAIFWLIFILCIAWGLWRREKGIALISLWWFLILLAANPYWINLPSEDLLDSFAVLIAAYFPAALIIGASAGWVISNLDIFLNAQADSRYRTARSVSILLVVMLFSLSGIRAARARLFDIQYPTFALVTRPDLRAAAWIKSNTPENASFLANSLFAYDNNLIVGSDAGWWLPLLAQRRTSIPPLTYGIEKGPNETYRTWINALPAEIIAKGINHPDVIQMLKERYIDYIYIGQQHGLVNANSPLLALDQIIADPHFEPVYHQDRVWIFRILHAQESTHEN